MMAVSKRHPNQSDASVKRNQSKTRFTKKNDAKAGKEVEGGKFWTIPRTIFIVCLGELLDYQLVSSSCFGITETVKETRVVFDFDRFSGQLLLCIFHAQVQL